MLANYGNASNARIRRLKKMGTIADLSSKVDVTPDEKQELHDDDITPAEIMSNRR